MATPSVNALHRLLEMYDQQHDHAAVIASGQENAEEMFAIQSLITLPRDLVRHGLITRPRNYVFTAPAQEVIANIKVTKHLTAERISKIKGRVYCLNFDKESAAFVWKHDSDIKMIYTWNYKDGGSSGIGTASLSSLFELTTSFSGESSLSEKATIALKGLDDLWRKVLQTLIFLELTEPEIEVMAAGKRHSERPLGTSNNSRQDVYVVSSTWNKYIIRTEGWGVRGHFRMQPCGVGHAELKLVWVTPYQKSGLTRKPQKQTDQ